MKIKSTFSDYYDFVGNQYGGGDPKVTYARHKINFNTLQERGVTDLPDSNCSPHNIYDYKWLVICGCYYLMLRPSFQHQKYANKNYVPEPWHILDQHLHADIYNTFVGKRRMFMKTTEFTYLDYCGRFSDTLVKVSRLVGAPVFCIAKKVRQDGSIIIDENVPILGGLGIPSIIPPEKMYQELSYFLANIMV